MYLTGYHRQRGKHRNSKRMSIRWFGKRGMLWREVGGALSQAKDRFPPPSLLLIQVGSNDLTEIKSVDLVDNITSDILRIKLLFPNAEVVWSEILMKRYWLNANDPFSEPANGHSLAI
jgi:hypothetical protein